MTRSDSPSERRPWGSLQGDVLAALRAAGVPLVPAQVQDALAGRVAYSTVQTILTRLLDKGLVQRGRSPKGGRVHEYWPTQDTETVTAQRMRDLLDGSGDRRTVLRQFAAELDPADVNVLRALLARGRGAST